MTPFAFLNKYFTSTTLYLYQAVAQVLQMHDGILPVTSSCFRITSVLDFKMTNMPRGLLLVHLCLSLEASYTASICSKTERVFIDYTHCQPAFKKKKKSLFY